MFAFSFRTTNFQSHDSFPICHENLVRLRGCGQNCESHGKTESWQVCYWPSLIFQESILDPSLPALLVLFI